MNKKRVAVMSIIMVGLLVITSTFFLLQRQPQEKVSPEPVHKNLEVTDLGFTYLQITPRISTYYNLGVNSGALVTEVVPLSHADAAGVRVGDVILSFNGAQVEETASLLQVMMAFPAGNKVTLEIQRKDCVSIVELIHTVR